MIKKISRSSKTKTPKRFEEPEHLTDYIDEFWRSYMGTALWSSNGDDDEPLDRDRSIDNIDPKTADDMREDCARFVTENEKLLEGWDAEIAGHCFWLNRNGHGSGFWDYDNGTEGSGKELAKKCGWKTKFGGVDLYVGDDGKIHSN